MITVTRARELLDYDPATGILRWKVRRNRHPAGTVAGSPVATGHILIGIDGRNYLAHRIAWLLTHGVFPPSQIDHVNGNPADNRISNLRTCTHAENHQNEKTRRDNRLGMTGVYFHKAAKRFAAQIKVNRTAHHLGYFDSAEEAQAAYLSAKERLHRFQSTPRDFTDGT